VQLGNAAILSKTLVEDSSISRKACSQGEYFTHWELILIYANELLCFVKSRANVILMIIYECAVFNTLNCALLITYFDMRFENDFVNFDDINWSVDLSCVFMSFWEVEFPYCVGKIYDDMMLFVHRNKYMMVWAWSICVYIYK
jgi:hypothetical protein